MADISNKLRMMRRHEMESRIDKFCMECTKAQTTIQDLLQEARGFIGIVEESEEHDRREKYLSCMQRLDEFTYTVLEFNLALEKFDSPSNPRIDETLDLSPESSKIPLNMGCFYGILDPIPSNVRTMSNTLQKKHKICPPDQLIDLDSSSSISTDNLNLCPSEITESAISVEQTTELTTQLSEDCNEESAMELTSMVTNENYLRDCVIKKEYIHTAQIQNSDICGKVEDANELENESKKTSNTFNNKDNEILARKEVSTEKKGKSAKKSARRKETHLLEKNAKTLEKIDKSMDNVFTENITRLSVEETYRDRIEKTEIDIAEKDKEAACELTIAKNMVNSIKIEVETEKEVTDMKEEAVDTIKDVEDNGYLAVKGHNGIEIQGIDSHAVNWNLEDVRKRNHASYIEATNVASGKEARAKTGVLPDQERLQSNEPYSCRILHIDSPDLLYICVGNMDEINECHEQMLVYYGSRPSFPSKDAIAPLSLNYCACRIRSSIWYRALVINFDFSPAELQVYLLDVGKKYEVHYSDVQPLRTEFAKLPAYARECYLVGLEPINFDGVWDPLAKELMNEYSSNACTVYVQEETNGALGVLLFRKKILINRQLIQKNLAQAGNDCHHLFALEGADIPEHDSDDWENMSISTEKPTDPGKVEFGEMGAEPALDNVLEAVTGYANRDEAEICKHYKGPPHTSCFKGSRCKKKHVKIHPDGWTLDKRAIVFQPIRNQELLLPGSTVSVYVSHVASYNVVFVMLRSEESAAASAPVSSLSPPCSLETLHARMNSAYARRNYRPLALPPAPHELVAARYADDCWYRARVTETDLDRDLVGVQYIDYGNRSWVGVSELCQLDEAFCVLPCQAYRCRLAGVTPMTSISAVDQGYELLQKLTLGFYFSAVVVSTTDSDMEVALFDKEKKEVAVTMAESGVVTYAPYDIAEKIIQVVPG